MRKQRHLQGWNRWTASCNTWLRASKFNKHIDRAIDIAYEVGANETAMFLENYKNETTTIENIVLGSGADASVIYPSFSGEKDFVSKISQDKYNIVNEYQIYKKLPVEGPYLNTQKVRLEKLAETEKIKCLQLSEKLNSKL